MIKEKMEKTTLFFALIIALTGCATGPIAISDAVPIPQERISNIEITKSKDGTGSVLFKRDSGFIGSACVLRLMVDGKPFADIQGGEKIQVYLAPGKHILGAKGTGICFDSHTETEVTITAGKTEVYRATAGAGGIISLHPTAF